MSTIFYSCIMNKTTVHNFWEQLHPTIRNFNDNICLYVVDIVLPILNCLCMFTFVYNKVRRLGSHYEDLEVCVVMLYGVSFHLFYTQLIKHINTFCNKRA